MSESEPDGVEAKGVWYYQLAAYGVGPVFSIIWGFYLFWCWAHAAMVPEDAPTSLVLQRMFLEYAPARILAVVGLVVGAIGWLFIRTRWASWWLIALFGSTAFWLVYVCAPAKP